MSPSSTPPPVLAFVHLEKTAGTTLKFLLRNSFGLHHCDTIHSRTPVFTADDYAFARRFFPRMKSLGGHNLVAPHRHLPAEVRFYTLLREPLARTVSHYQDDQVRGTDTRPLDTWLREPGHRNLMTTRIAGTPDLEAAKRILREHYLFTGTLEAFDDSLRLLAHHSPYPIDPRYLVRNTAKDNRIKKRLQDSPEDRTRLEAANDLDLPLYAWLRQEWLPQQLAALPPGFAPNFRAALARRTLRERTCDLYNKGLWRQAAKRRRSTL